MLFKNPPSYSCLTISHDHKLNHRLKIQILYWIFALIFFDMSNSTENTSPTKYQYPFMITYMIFSGVTTEKGTTFKVILDIKSILFGC